MFQVLDQMSELIYVVDLENYDLLYINKACRELFHLEEPIAGKCYQILQNMDSPCAFCTNDRLTEDSFYTWEKTNTILGRHFLLKDKIINWNGRKARVEVAFDMTEQEKRRKSISDALELQNLVTECARRLYEADEDPLAIQEVLHMSGEYLQSDRVYIFEIQGDTMSNTHEWCARGVEPQISRLQNLPVSLVDHWREQLMTQKYVIIEDTEKLKESSPEEYRILKEQDVRSIIEVPLFFHNKLAGYVGVDNFALEMRENTASFLNAIGYFISSIIRQMRTLAQLERLSYYDSLTEIKNRNAYVLNLTKEYHAPVGVAYLDVNGMKEINNRLGHKCGDDVLRLTARVLTSVFGSEDCYRIGGDEFIAISEEADFDRFCEKVRQLKSHFEFRTDFRVSMGVSWKREFSSLRDIVFEADAAMFKDKKEFYRGRVVSGRYRSQTDDILGIADPIALRKMIDAGQFHVFYQPQIDIKTQQLTGAEALVRFQDAAGGFYPPSQFIPILEETRLIGVLDFYVFECVCSQLKAWIEAGITVVPVATNFSRHTLAVTGFADRLQKICNKYEISKALLEIEITETVEADDRQLFYRAIEQLKQREFRISIDDFGVNNANLTLLTDVDFHVLKIDKQVIDTICSKEKTRLLVSALINICHEFGIEVIAEGVESQEQSKILWSLDCDTAQGYLYGRPIPTEEYRDRFLKQ